MVIQKINHEKLFSELFVYHFGVALGLIWLFVVEVIIE